MRCEMGDGVTVQMHPGLPGGSAATLAAPAVRGTPDEAVACLEPGLAELVDQAMRGADRDHPAVIEGPRSLSYGLLDAASAALANELADTEGTVAIALPRGADVITAMIACIR